MHLSGTVPTYRFLLCTFLELYRTYRFLLNLNLNLKLCISHAKEKIEIREDDQNINVGWWEMVYVVVWLLACGGPQ